MLNQLPDDQRSLILARLGRDKVTEIENKYSDLVTEPSKLPPTRGDLIRGQPSMREPLTAFYMACVREMGSAGAASGPAPKIPTPEQAWMEVLRQRPKTFEDIEKLNESAPTFSHPKISECIIYHGGWRMFWRLAGRLAEKHGAIDGQDKMRYRFQKSYEKLL